MVFLADLADHSDKIAVIKETGESINYRSLLNAAEEVGKRVNKRCLIFVLCRNCLESIAGYLGFLRTDAVQVLLDETMDPFLLTRLLEAYRPEYIYAPANTTLENNGFLRIYSYGDYVLFKTDYETDYLLDDDLAMLLTTSGSTGSKKFVRLSKKNIISNAEVIAQYLEINDTDRPITTMPMSYSYGLSIINSHLLKGACLIPTEATLMEKRFWELIKTHKATTFGGVPYIYEMLKKLRFERMTLPSLKYITQAGGKLKQELAAEFTDICLSKGIKFYIMYGQTEATARMSYLPWDKTCLKAGSVGIPIPEGRFWLEDSDGKIIEAEDKAGELVYQGPNVSLGYAEDRFDLAKGDENKGILRTGDIAKRDRDGFYYIVGRQKRFLKIFGKRINLEEIESLISLKYGECVCAGIDDNLRVYLTNPDSRSQVENYIVEHLGINRSGFTILNIKEVPRNKAGKVLYKDLEEVGLDV